MEREQRCSGGRDENAKRVKRETLRFGRHHKNQMLITFTGLSFILEYGTLNKIYSFARKKSSLVKCFTKISVNFQSKSFD